jgi:hypothetical protein
VSLAQAIYKAAAQYGAGLVTLAEVLVLVRHELASMLASGGCS